MCPHICKECQVRGSSNHDVAAGKEIYIHKLECVPVYLDLEDVYTSSKSRK